MTKAEENHCSNCSKSLTKKSTLKICIKTVQVSIKNFECEVGLKAFEQ